MEVQWVGRDVTDRVQAEIALKELNQDFVTFLDNATDFIFFKDIHSRFRFCSQTMASLAGFQHWKDMRGKHDLEVLPKEIAQAYADEELPIFRHGTPILNKIKPYVDQNGQTGWVSTSKWPMRDSEGAICGIFGISRVVTDQIRLEQKHQQLLVEQQAILDNDLISIMVAKGTTMSWVNPAFEKMFGYDHGELIGQSTRMGYCSDEDFETFNANAFPVFASGGSYRTEFDCRKKDGSRFTAEVSGAMLANHTGQSLWCFVDITERKRNEEKVRLLAFFDPLTLLPNRRLFADRFTQALAHSERNKSFGALLVLDLDNFKPLNDTHGHACGDLLLQEVARRISSCVRETDTVGRFGGDEFVVVLWPLVSHRDESEVLARAIAEKIRLAIGEPYKIAAHGEPAADEYVTHRCTASVGAVPFLGSRISAEELFRRADAVMYEAKKDGHNRVKFDSDFAR